MAHFSLHEHAEHMLRMTEVLLDKDNLTDGWSNIESAMAAIDQGLIATIALLLGAALVARGFALMKPCFVLSTALALGCRTFIVACREGFAQILCLLSHRTGAVSEDR